MRDEYHGRGYEELYWDYVDFSNYVFGFNGDSKNFVKLLPKVFKPEYEPVKSSYVTLIDGRLKASIGAFDHEITVAGELLRCRGIGNVAVHPFARSKGYMRKLMEMAIDDMVSDRIDLSILGGRRQRYNYFSYEKTGEALRFVLNADNMRHCFGADRSARHTVDIVSISPGDLDVLSKIARLLAGRDYAPIRPEEKLYDILTSWESVPYALFKGERFAGYLIYKADEISEIMLSDQADFEDAIISFYDKRKLKNLSIVLPPFEPELIGRLYRISEGYTIGSSKSFSVLNFRRVTEAFLKLKLKYETLPDGELRLKIHGRAGEENIVIRVRGGVGSVSEVGTEPFGGTGPSDGIGPSDGVGVCCLELGHIDAMNLLFSPYCPGRSALPAAARLWLPLPLWLYKADAV